MKILFWHRRDLRIHDNAGLYKALKMGGQVQPVFIFDTTILDLLPRNDQRVRFIHEAITRLHDAYKQHGAILEVYVGNPKEILPQLVADGSYKAVVTNRDYEPYAKERDRYIAEKLKALNCDFVGAKDHVIFEKLEVVKDDGKPYTVFTPYMRKWKAKLNDFYFSSYPVERYAHHLVPVAEEKPIPSLKELGFRAEELHVFPPETVNDELLKRYAETRNFPAINGTSKLSVHLRFGTISIRELARQAQRTNETYLNELIWRDFYQMILFVFPESPFKAIKPAYDRIEWEKNEEHFAAWCAGKTGYPLVDAGMRELNTTGHMHNRVRMVVASFLTKHLLLDWRLGERYFAEKLLDFELASNVGGWQWASGSGCDAAPYFRIFNPESQLQKFDPELKYIKKWVPEYGTCSYPKPIIDHQFARNRCLERYKKGLAE